MGATGPADPAAGINNTGGPLNVGILNKGALDVGIANSATNAITGGTSGVANSGRRSSGAFHSTDNQSGFFNF